MKRSFVRLLLLILTILTVQTAGYPIAYEASTLHNAVARSETVLDLFYERWERITAMDLYVDWMGRINWINNFKVYAVNAGNRQRQVVDMTLVRTYGSITVGFPILGSYEEKDAEKRLQYGTGKYKKEQEKDDGGLWKPQNLVLAFTATGFHYGLTRKSQVDRGSAQSETITDYKFSQFFDDVYAVSLLYRPYFYIHTGVIVNKQFDPKDDGTMSYANPTSQSVRYFFASNLLSFANINATTTKKDMESLTVGIVLNKIVGLAIKNIPSLVPVVGLTYKQIRLYNDEPWDPVWVNSPKSPVVPDSEKQHAKLHTFSVDIKENLFNMFYIDFFAEFQKPSASLVEKRTGREIRYQNLRQINCMVGYNFVGDKVKDGYLLLASVGMSRYWDISIPLNRNAANNVDTPAQYYVYGWIVDLEGRIPFLALTFDVRTMRNYAPDLRKLVEATDKYMIETSVSLSF